MLDKDQQLKTVFRDCYGLFQSELWREDHWDYALCALHDCFGGLEGESHNCLGCNFAEVTEWIGNYLAQHERFSAVDEAFTFYLLRLYLFVERANTVFEIIELPVEYRYRHFGVFKDINKWANFIKHPHAFILPSF